MSFELTNALANFQSCIHLTLRYYFNISCIVYFDNVLVYSNDKKIHEKHVRLIFEKLRKFELFVNLKKCFFDLNEMDYLKYLMNTIKRKKISSKFKLLKSDLKQNFIKIFNFS